MTAAVTIVVATYNRPDALTLALELVRLQTMQDWRVLVVGDCCRPETGRAVANIGDARISYINLAKRSGEQSGPNSVGMRLAETPLIAFLNHDDIWLPDHLSIALRKLSDPKVDLFVSRAAFADTRIGEGEDERPFFHSVSRKQRTLSDGFHGSMALFEPASSWVFRKALAERVGDWRHSADLFRTSLQDWTLRAARANATLVLYYAVSLLKFTTHKAAAGAHYDFGAHDQRYVLDLLKTRGVDAVRDLIKSDLANTAAITARRGAAREPDAELLWLRERLMTPQLAEVFHKTGWDALDAMSEILGRQRGRVFRSIVKKRTGQEPEPPPTVDELMQLLAKCERGH